MAQKTYTPMPAIAPEVAKRYETVMEVLSGSLSVSEGARRLDLSRVHFQTLMHRALGAMVEELTPKMGGRPPIPERERQLQQETERLRLENLRLKSQAETTERILNVASGLLHGRLVRRRERHPPKKPTEDE